MAHGARLKIPPLLLRVWRCLNISSAYCHPWHRVGGSPAPRRLGFAFLAAGCVTPREFLDAQSQIGVQIWSGGASVGGQPVRDLPALRDPQRSSLQPRGALTAHWGLVRTRWEGAGGSPVPWDPTLPPVPTTAGGQARLPAAPAVSTVLPPPPPSLPSLFSFIGNLCSCSLCS